MTLQERHDKPIPCARALYPFQGQSEVELSFDAGVSIQLLRRVDENWLEGRLNGKVGIFPGNHVRVELGSPSLSHESSLAGSGKPFGIALNDFRGDCAGDLPLKKGDLVELLGSAGNGWMRGRLKGAEGIFPTSFVEVLQPHRSSISRVTSAPPTSNAQVCLVRAFLSLLLLTYEHLIFCKRSHTPQCPCRVPRNSQMRNNSFQA